MIVIYFNKTVYYQRTEVADSSCVLLLLLKMPLLLPLILESSVASVSTDSDLRSKFMHACILNLAIPAAGSWRIIH